MADRNYEYEKQQADIESKAYLRGLLRYTVESIDSLRELNASNSVEVQQEFKSNVDGLSKFYYFKFSKTGVDVERPEEMEDEELEGPADLTGKSVRDCKKIFYRIMELQEELGHTSLESMSRGNRRI